MKKHILAVAGQKGGSTKTTTTCKVAQALVKDGKRVLVVDLDPQANATQLLLPEGESTGEIPSRPTLADVLFRDRPLAKVLVETPSGIALVPGSQDLEAFDLTMAWEAAIGPDGRPYLAPRPGREERLRRALVPVEGDYDLVLIDCPPSLSLLFVNGLVAAHAVLTPVVPALLSLRSMERLEQTIQAGQGLNPELQHLGYLLCCVDEREAGTAVAREALKKRPHLKNEIRVDASLKGVSARRTHAIRDYEAAAEELLRRMRRV